jgi:DHA1 family bicyclomycin/chloramphenicol resistance-like MFS transporter
MAGTASSLAGTLRFGTGTVVSGIVALLHNSTVWPMAATMALCSVLSAAFYWLLAKNA